MDAPIAEPPLPRVERRGLSRRIAASRAVWFATRARNASRRGWRITSVGGVAVIATLLVLVLVPREVDRALREQLERIPTSSDTLQLAQQINAMNARQTVLRHVDSVRVAQPRGVPTVGLPIARDTLDVELAQRIARAREVPLAESYLALADARALTGDARVRAIADSIEAVDREREAYAALGGADAHYAALTSRLATLGQRLIRLAESRNDGSPRSAPTDSSSATTFPMAPNAGVANAAAVAVAAEPPGIATTAVRAPVSVDSAPTRRAAIADSIERIRQQLAAVRLTNAALEQRRVNVRARLNVSVPPIAMLLSALIVGLSIGYGVSVVRELRKPTVGDEAEVERMTNARVVVQRAANRTRPPQTVRRRSDGALPSIISVDESSYPLLHLALTGIGDVAHAVEVVAEHPGLATVVAINVATVAARESRTALVVEDTTSPHLLDELLRQSKGADAASHEGTQSSVSSIVVERDITVDVLRARTPAEARARVIDRYDLTLLPTGAEAASALVEGRADDVIICVRLAATSLAWLTAVTRRASARRQRIRAVLLWVTDLPTLPPLSPSTRVGYSPNHVG